MNYHNIDNICNLYQFFLDMLEVRLYNCCNLLCVYVLLERTYEAV
jgi:hypothetical protein